VTKEAASERSQTTSVVNFSGDPMSDVDEHGTELDIADPATSVGFE